MEEKLNSGIQTEWLAFEKGYKIDRFGNVYNKKDELVNPVLTTDGYLKFKLRINFRKSSQHVKYHRFQAFMKFGFDLYIHDLVRHLNNVKTDNSWENIALGSHKENFSDNPPSYHKNMLKSAVQANRRFTDSQVLKMDQLRNEGITYKEIGDIFEANKSTIHYVLNKNDYSLKLIKNN